MSGPTNHRGQGKTLCVNKTALNHRPENNHQQCRVSPNTLVLLKSSQTPLPVDADILAICICSRKIKTQFITLFPSLCQSSQEAQDISIIIQSQDLNSSENFSNHFSLLSQLLEYFQSAVFNLVVWKISISSSSFLHHLALNLCSLLITQLLFQPSQMVRFSLPHPS